jgi:hypothetical protein
MSTPRIILWTGGNAPNRQAALKVEHSDYTDYDAYWEPGYCGCPDCHPLIGHGDTPAEAIANYWEKWEDTQ